MKIGRLVACAAVILVATTIFYVATIVLFLGTVPIPQPGWIQGPEVARKPASGSWLGFRHGMPRLLALDNACKLVTDQRLDAVDFSCPRHRANHVGIVADGPPGTWSEAWTFHPRLYFWQRHCFGIKKEQLNIFIKDDRVEALNVDCGVIDL